MSWDLDTIPKFLINLDKRQDRLKKFMNGTGVKDLTMLKRISAVDGTTINIDTDNRVSIFTRYTITTNERRSHMELNTKGGVGCYISHVEIWRNFLEHYDSEVGLVLEDDLVFNEKNVKDIRSYIDNSPILQNTDMWDFCILGAYYGTKYHESVYPDDNNCMTIMKFEGMTAYLINKKGIKKILDKVYPIQGHIDGFLSICAQLGYINICGPEIPLIMPPIVFNNSDIQLKNCKICNIKSDFQKDHTIVSNLRMNIYIIEELILFGIIIYMLSKMKTKR